MRKMQIIFRSLGLAFVLVFSIVGNATAQRVFADDRSHVIYEDARHKQKDLGVGFAPTLTATGKVLTIRGIVPDYGADFDCSDAKLKNWVAIYDPATGKERTLFDEPVHYPDFDMEGGWCIFADARLSPDGKTLYLAIPMYATSRQLAIIRLADKMMTFVSADFVYIIEDGPHRGDLILVGRRLKKDVDGFEYPYDPFIHADPSGLEIQVISDEFFAGGGLKYTHAPILAEYLKRLGGHITVNGEQFP